MNRHDEDQLIEQLAETARRALRQINAEALRGPRPGVEDRLLSGVRYDERRRGRRPWIAVGTAVLAVFMVAGLLSSRWIGSQGTRHAATAAPTPVATGIGGPVSPSPGHSPFVSPGTTTQTGAVLCTLPLDFGSSAGFVAVLASGVQPNGVPLVIQPSIDPTGRPRLPDGEDAINVSYDWGLRKWLPVSSAWVAPNGLAYAYSDRQGSLHVVDPTTGTDRAVNHDRWWAVVDYAPEGIYAAVRASASQPATGLWLIDPAAGGARMIDAAGSWQFVNAHGAYGLASPQYAAPNFVYGSGLVILDLNTGKTTTLYTRPATPFRLVGVDAQGNPYITDWQPGAFGTALVEVTAPGTLSSALAAGSWMTAVADGDRTWFVDSYGHGLWLKDAAGMRNMGQAGYPTGSGAPQAAGGCQ